MESWKLMKRAKDNLILIMIDQQVSGGIFKMYMKYQQRRVSKYFCHKTGRVV